MLVNASQCLYTSWLVHNGEEQFMVVGSGDNDKYDNAWAYNDCYGCQEIMMVTASHDIENDS